LRYLLPVLFALAAPGLAAQAHPGRIKVRIETSLGPIDAQLDSAHAPVTVANFLRYVDGRLFDSSAFFRTVTLANQPGNAVKIQVIQSRRARSAPEGFGPIRLERTTITGLHHRDGTLSMARSGPDTGSDQFFICIGNQPELDFGGKRNADGQGFAAFGRVTAGMAIVRQIQRSPATGQNLTNPVTILRIVRR
jgi:peptidyl-prolyl cis-trans isomerase A (cyclophilin A)